MIPITIQNHTLKQGGAVFIIAEAGVNHNGEISLAKELILAAKESGADCVKFQTFKSKNLVTKSAVKAQYQVDNMGSNESQREMLEKLELKQEQFLELIEFSRKNKILFLTTPYGIEDLAELQSWNVSAVKIASAMSVEPRFVKAAAELNVPLFLSLGMATLEEIEPTWAVLTPEMRARTILLHCTTNYPANPHQSNLRVLETLKNKFGTLVGYSDHTPGFETSLMAVAMGAVVLEKHLTLDKKMSGPDHAASHDPLEFKAYVETVRSAEKSLGTGEKIPADEELQNIERMRRSLVAVRDLNQGEIIREEDLTVKRPATGIAPRDWDRVVGMTLKKNLLADTVMTWDLFE